MKSMMQSIQPQYCEPIANHKKKNELRKTKPKIPTPFKVYIYCCKPKQILRYVWNKADYEGYPFADQMDDNEKVFCKIPDGSSPFCSSRYAGKVIGEYTCNGIDEYEIEGGKCSNNIHKAIYHIWRDDETGEEYSTCEISNEVSEKEQWLQSPLLRDSCLSFSEIEDYVCGDKPIGFYKFYSLYISDLKIYDKPKELSEFCIIDDDAVKKCCYRARAYNNPDYTNGAWLPGAYICHKSGEIEWCSKCIKKPLTRPPQSYCYVEELDIEENTKSAENKITTFANSRFFKEN